MESVARQTGETPPELENLLEMPEALTEVWVWFKRLSNRRQSGMGVNPILFSEMASFFSLMGIVPRQEEVQVLELLDSITCSHHNKKQAEEQKKATSKNKR